MTLSRVRAGDRLGLTLFFAIILHSIVILGISFTPQLKRALDNSVQTMDITLVQSASDKKPDDAQYLAQVDHLGSGNTEEKQPPKAPAKEHRITPEDRTGQDTQVQVAAAPQVKRNEIKRPEVLTTNFSENELTESRVSKNKIVQPALTAAELMTRSMEIASLSAELRQQEAAFTGRKRHTHISASTQEFKYSAYMEAWRSKVERIGRLNYPEAAREQRIYGNLLLDVAIREDGTIDNISLRRSSGNKILDDAAIRIVRLASPFAPLPENIREETDVLHILRTWIFQNGNRLSTQ